MSTGALAGQHVCDVRAAPDEPVVGVNAPVESHATIARTVDRDDLVAGTLCVQLLLEAVVHR